MSATAPQGWMKRYGEPSNAIDGDDTLNFSKCLLVGAPTLESLFTATIPLSLVDSIGFFGVC